MRFDFTKSNVKDWNRNAMQGDVRLREVNDTIVIEFGNSAINKLGIEEGSYFRYAFNEETDEYGRVFEAGRYIAFEFYGTKLRGCRKISKGRDKYFLPVRGKEEVELLRAFMDGQTTVEYKLYVDAYSESEEKTFVIDKRSPWDETKAENYRKKYGGRH